MVKQTNKPTIGICNFNCTERYEEDDLIELLKGLVEQRNNKSELFYFYIKKKIEIFKTRIKLSKYIQ